MEKPKKTILILDDTKPIRILLLKRLERKYNCILSSNPLKAMKIMQEYGEDIDLIITDFQMPGMNGQEFLKKIQIPARHLPVIMLSSNLNELRIRDLYHLGVRIFMAKPVKMNRLVKEINNILGDDDGENGDGQGGDPE